MRNQRLSIPLPAKQLREIKAISKAELRTVTNVVCRLIDEALAARREEKQKEAGV